MASITAYAKTWASLYFCMLLLSSVSQVRAAFFLRPNAPPRISSRRRLGARGEDDASNLQHESPPSKNRTAAPSSAFEDALFLERFRRRRDESSSNIDIARSSRPPSNSTRFADPKNVVASILEGLLRPHDPAPYFGYEVLYASSTARWRDVLRKSVGAPEGTEEGLILRALGAGMERPDNQFGILVGAGTDRGSSAREPEGCVGEDGCYGLEFPRDTLDYLDGTAWVECRLRDKRSDALLVVVGWSMEQWEDDGSWLIDGIDWQDFREKYRPGIGREEWERICG